MPRVIDTQHRHNPHYVPLGYDGKTVAAIFVGILVGIAAVGGAYWLVANWL